MKRIITISVILLSLALVLGSCASRKYTKKGEKLELAGQYEQAADMYYRAIVEKNTNLDAKDGLKRTSQMTLSKKLTEFNKSYTNQDNKEAVSKYLDARKYYDKIAGVGITLSFPSFYDEYYAEVKDIYLEDKYYEGITLLDEEKFSQAERVFREIVKLQKNYKDSKDKLNTAIYEPKYREGLDMMETNRYRQAYYQFEDIINGAGAYKSSYDLKAECLKKGTMTIVINGIDNNTSVTGIETTLESKIISQIKGFNNPFVKLIDSQNQTRSTDPNDRTTSKAITSSVTLYVTISKFTYNRGSQDKIEKHGYLRKRVKVMNRETEKYEYKTEYSKVVYYEYKMTRSLDMSYAYKLVDNRTSEILSTETKNILVRDDIHYAKYDGDKKNLVSGYWKSKTSSSSEDFIKDNNSSNKALNSLLSSRSSIKDYNTLSSEAIGSSSDIISKSVNQYVNEN